MEAVGLHSSGGSAVDEGVVRGVVFGGRGWVGERLTGEIATRVLGTVGRVLAGRVPPCLVQRWGFAGAQWRRGLGLVSKRVRPAQGEEV